MAPSEIEWLRTDDATVVVPTRAPWPIFWPATLYSPSWSSKGLTRMASKKALIWPARALFVAVVQARPQKIVKTSTAPKSWPLLYVSCAAGPAGTRPPTTPSSSGTYRGTMRTESERAGNASLLAMATMTSDPVPTSGCLSSVDHRRLAPCLGVDRTLVAQHDGLIASQSLWAGGTAPVLAIRAREDAGARRERGHAGPAIRSGLEIAECLTGRS